MFFPAARLISLIVPLTTASTWKVLADAIEVTLFGAYLFARNIDLAGIPARKSRPMEWMGPSPDIGANHSTKTRVKMHNHRAQDSVPRCSKQTPCYAKKARRSQDYIRPLAQFLQAFPVCERFVTRHNLSVRASGPNISPEHEQCKELRNV